MTSYINAFTRQEASTVSFNVLCQSSITAVSASTDTLVAALLIYHHNASLFSSHQFEFLAISPVALSILISSPHDEARVVVVVVQAVQ